ncbi:D-amino-acid transaminase [Sporosarcina ureilytica]|uniref:D-alanine aminotransferase n=1 Tax=Sporosarcina ureilytica TaxID=298596 RepID=A0A1D8JER4_9BACL|nr:D-amino-acid transaminase [Sporosarcina ureilytica]AOV07189.1 D-amino-acid transaminase [Sporosarcina ureilytica]
MTFYFIDGQFTKQDEIKISIDDRGYYFGDGVYEVIKVYGGELFTAEEHISRLTKSAAKINLTMPYSEDQLIGVARELIDRNNLLDGHVYMQVTRGAAVRQHHFPVPAVPAVVTAYTMEGSRPKENMKSGVAVKSVEDIRWLRCDIKSLNLLGSVLAKEEAKAAGCEEAILHRDGIVTEGSSTNMFGVKDGVVRTHPVSNLILEGITRQVVLQLCDELNIPVEEKAFTLAEAFEMDEVFYTSTTAEVMPVITIDGQTIGDGQRGNITKKLQKAFATKIPSLCKQ